MQKRKKQLLGLSGLAVVGLMTAVALSLPASAVDNATGNQGTTVTVRVAENGASSRITSPLNGAQIVDPAAQATVATGNIAKLNATLRYKGADGQMVEKTYPEMDATGQDLVSFPLGLPLGETEYTLKVVATGVNGTVLEDTVTFTYRALSVVSKGETSKDHDPIVRLTANGSVKKVQIQAYTQGSNPKEVFVSEDGGSEALVLAQSDFTNGEAAVTLPFTKYGAKAGTYEVVAIAYGDNNEIISMNRVTVKYNPSGTPGPVDPNDPNNPNNPDDPNNPTNPDDPNTPDTPSTGSMLWDNLNISSMDYLLTGLIAFSAVAGFAVYLVFRKNRR